MLPRNLKYVCDSDNGISRKRKGRGFVYLDSKGKNIENEETQNRVKDLIIPPNWKDVWICQDPDGYLQVTGFDEKGRKQYLYHELYTTYRQKHKYNSLYNFGITLPVIRARTDRDLKREGWPKEKVLALIVKTLDEFHLRIGSEQYAQENETYGITTLRRKHISEKKGVLTIEFKGKSGKFKTLEITNPKLKKLIKETSELPGYEIFRYLDENNKSCKIHSHEVNEYIQEITGSEYSAKHFRTWGGTVAALDVSNEAKKEIEENPRKKLDTAIIKKVAERLNNTIATCREYYIHPKVLKAAIEKEIKELPEEDTELLKYPHLLRKNEKRVLSIIKN